jgi:hypothetical protein
MLQRRFAGASVFFGFLIALAPALVRADDAPKAPARTGKCLMWKVASPTATVYLIGSIHVATEEMYPLAKEMEEAFVKSDTLVVEVNMNKIDQARLLQFVQEKGMYKDGKTLSGALSKETVKALTDFCGQLGLPAAALELYKPWFVSLQLQVMAIQKAGYDPRLGIDMHFIGQAEKSNKKIEELETAEFQLNMLAGFDAELQAKALAATLDEMKDLKADVGQIKDAWVAGDAKLLSELLSKSSKKHPELREIEKKVVDERNGPMAEKVEAYLKGNQTIFLIAGCAHMVGDKGIVKILRDHHFTVEQSSATPAKEKKGE